MENENPPTETLEDNMEAVLGASESTKPKDIRLVDVNVTDDNVALNLIVAFLNLGQKRGAFGMDESAKIWECVQRFIQK